MALGIDDRTRHGVPESCPIRRTRKASLLEQGRQPVKTPMCATVHGHPVRCHHNAGNRTPDQLSVMSLAEVPHHTI